jgi:septation ring formation regulator EzrA
MALQVLLPLPLLAVTALAVPWAFTGGGTRRWGRGRVEDLRAEAQQAKDAAAEAFYQLDSTQRDLRISIETISAVDDSPQAKQVKGSFTAFGLRIDQVSHEYISVMDAHDLESATLDATAASRARHELVRVRDELNRVKSDLEGFGNGLGALLERAETQLQQLAPAVERAKRALLTATQALDEVRAARLQADELAATLAALAPELRLLNEGAAQHGVKATVQRAEDVQRRAEAITAQAKRMPQQAADMDRRLSSLRTRAQAIATRAEKVDPILSELRRRFSAACWQDLQGVPQQAAESVRQAEETLREAQRARDEQHWTEVSARLTTVQALLGRTDEAVSAAGERLQRLNEVSFDPSKEIEKTRFTVRDAQRMAMSGRSVPDPRHAKPLDEAVERLERAVTALERGGRNPDYWLFLVEMQAVRDMVGAVVDSIRGQR